MPRITRSTVVLLLQICSFTFASYCRHSAIFSSILQTDNFGQVFLAQENGILSSVSFELASTEKTKISGQVFIYSGAVETLLHTTPFLSHDNEVTVNFTSKNVLLSQGSVYSFIIKLERPQNVKLSTHYSSYEEPCIIDGQVLPGYPEIVSRICVDTKSINELNDSEKSVVLKSNLEDYCVGCTFDWDGNVYVQSWGQTFQAPTDGFITNITFEMIEFTNGEVFVYEDLLGNELASKNFSIGALVTVDFSSFNITVVKGKKYSFQVFPAEAVDVKVSHDYGSTTYPTIVEGTPSGDFPPFHYQVCFEGPPTSSGSKKDNTPIIAGVVGGVGGVLIVGLGIGAFLFLRKKKKNLEKDDPKQQKQEAELETTKVEPATTPVEQAEPVKSPGQVLAQSNQVMMEKWKIDYTEIQMGPLIGEGAFGSVYKARWRNCDCAVKQIKIDSHNEQAVEGFLKEAKTVLNLRNHKNICSIFGICNDPQYPICIVMEFVSGGSLQHLVYDDSFPLTLSMVLGFATDIASGMSHIHREDQLHCDLAARNVLLEKHSSKKYTAKIADLGLAKRSIQGIYQASADTKLPIRWTAPEALTKNMLSRASDVWSFGIVMWEMLEGKQPYWEMQNSEVVQYVCVQKKTLARPDRIECPDELWNVMLKCWSQKPADRPSFDQLCTEMEDLKKKYKRNTTTQPQAPADDSVYETAESSDDSSSGSDEPDHYRETTTYGNSSLSN